MTTITDIRNDLLDVFNKLKSGAMDPKDAFEINNTAGKIISSAKVQLAYAALRGEQPDIPFLAASPAKPLELPNEERMPDSPNMTQEPSDIDRLWHKKIGAK